MCFFVCFCLYVFLLVFLFVGFLFVGFLFVCFSFVCFSFECVFVCTCSLFVCLFVCLNGCMCIRLSERDLIFLTVFSLTDGFFDH